MNLPLYIPQNYLQATDKQRASVCNGCGAKNGAKVPNTIWGISIKTACNIHDWMFNIGKTKGDYYFANIMFFWNMTAIVVNASNVFTLLIRMERVLTYFLGVMSSKGVKAYWVDKSVKDESNTITIRGEFV